MRHRRNCTFIGAPQSGKSFFAKLMADRYFEAGQGSVLVYDINIHASSDWYKYTPIKLNELHLIKQNKGKYFLNEMGADKADEIKKELILAERFKNGLLIFDDCVNLESSTRLSKPMLRLVSSYRHLGIDVFTIWHCINVVAPDVYRYSSDIFQFRTNSQPYKQYQKIPNFEIIQANYFELKKLYDYYLRINKGNAEKIPPHIRFNRKHVQLK